MLMVEQRWSATANGTTSATSPVTRSSPIPSSPSLTTVSCTRSTTGAKRRPLEDGSPSPCSARPIPQPRQVFGIGLNYRDHAGESGTPLPPAPLTFTKFPSCITGPTAEVPLSGDMVDWEVEIVAVIGDKATASRSLTHGMPSPA